MTENPKISLSWLEDAMRYRLRVSTLNRPQFLHRWSVSDFITDIYGLWEADQKKKEGV